MSRAFDGTNDIINCGNNAVLRITGDNTIFWWSYWRNGPAAGSTDVAISWGKANELEADNFLYAHGVNNTAGTYKYRAFHEGGAGTNAEVLSSTAVTFNAWERVGVIKDETGNTYQFIVNNTIESAQSFATSASGGTDASIVCELGGIASLGLFSDVILAHVHIYNVTLTSNEIQQIARYPGSIRRGLVGYWPLWGASSPEPDYSGNGNHGTVTEATSGTTNPPINGIFYPPTANLYYSSFSSAVVTAGTAKINRMMLMGIT